MSVISSNGFLICFDHLRAKYISNKRGILAGHTGFSLRSLSNGEAPRLGASSHEVRAKRAGCGWDGKQTRVPARGLRCKIGKNFVHVSTEAL